MGIETIEYTIDKDTEQLIDIEYKIAKKRYEIDKLCIARDYLSRTNTKDNWRKIWFITN